MYDFEQYKLNIPEIDSDHLDMLELLSQLANKSVSDSEKSLLRVRFIELSARHLSLELKIMSEAHYPVEEAHTAEHLKILHQAMDLSDNFTTEDITQLLEYLLHHIDTFDRAFSIFISKNRSRRKSDQEKRQERRQQQQQLSLWPALPEV
jgi:hemerythrin